MIRYTPFGNSDQVQVDDACAGAGAAYVFEKTGATWTQRAFLKASNSDIGDDFGAAVSIDGNTAVVSAPGEQSCSRTDQNDESCANGGAVYVYFFDGSNWTFQAYVKAGIPRENDSFGSSLQLENDRVVLGVLGCLQTIWTHNVQVPVRFLYSKGRALLGKKNYFSKLAIPVLAIVLDPTLPLMATNYW